MTTLLTFDDIKKIEALNGRQSLIGIDFGDSTCCDYVDSLVTDYCTLRQGSGCTSYGVVVFVEPCGNITKADGADWGEILDWWIKVFETQPKEWDYITAGHYLMDLFEADKLPDDPLKVWPDVVEPSPPRPALIEAQRALGRVGVTFTPEQQGSIQEMVEAGKTVEAQRAILAHIEKELGG